MRNVKLIIEYNGKNFHGWQAQPRLRTVQVELKRVLEMVLRSPLGNLTAAGRTDTGVHARGQVVNFRIEEELAGKLSLKQLRRSVSCILRDELSVLEAEFVPEEFDARRALAKQYSYTVLWRDTPPVLDAGRVWHISGELAIERMQREAAAIIGRHDFTSFRGADSTAKTSIREVLESEVLHKPPYVIYRVVGKGFLKQMVRNIAGTLVMMGRGKLPAGMAEVLSARDRRAAGVTAPACGLCLDWVKYQE